jgi:hypothetical protein
MATPTKKKAAERDKRTERVYKKPTKTPPRKRVTKEATRPRETPATPQKKRVAERDKRTERVYRKPVGAPLRKPTEKITPRPEGGPTPMIRPGVGPVAQLSSQAAHTYGMTPEAYNELASIPTRLAPPENDFDRQTAGYYQPGDNDSIRLVSGQGGDLPATLAHEQAHGWWFRRGMDEPAVRSEYEPRFNEWTARPGPMETFEDGSTSAGRSAAAFARQDMDAELALYPNPDYHPTELYARTVEMSPNRNRQDWPDEVRPYYSGFLQGMDTLQGGQPTGPIPRNQVIEAGPDANGLYGSPARRWR